MTIIKPNIQQVDSFTIAGFSTRTRNSEEANTETAKIPKLWEQFYASELKDTIPAFGGYADYESDANGFYTLTVGVKTDDKNSKLNRLAVREGRYLVFKNTGPMPDTVINTWCQVWDYFAKETKYARNFVSDFERYIGLEVAIYIGIL